MSTTLQYAQTLVIASSDLATVAAFNATYPTGRTGIPSAIVPSYVPGPFTQGGSANVAPYWYTVSTGFNPLDFNTAEVTFAASGGAPAARFYWNIIMLKVGAPTAATPSGGPAPPPTPVVSIGTWDQQVVTWTGDATSGRLVPTNFPLNTGKVAIWILPQVTEVPCFRHSAMSGTMYANAAPSTTAGIMAFGATGFTVTTDGNCHVNQAGAKYTAVVLRDATSDNRYMQLGSFYGWDTKAWVGNHTINSGLVTACTQATLQDIGRVISFGAPHYTILGVNEAADTMQIAPAMSSSGSGDTWNSVPASDYARIIPTTFTRSGVPTAPTQLWVFSQGCPAYRTDEFTGANSVLFITSAVSLTDEITSMGASGFTAGDSLQTQDVTDYFVAFCIPVGDPIRQVFATYSKVGNGSIVQVLGLPFTPAFAVARPFSVSSIASVWRGPWNTTVASQDTNPAAVEATQGIRAFGSGTIDLGTTSAPNGVTTYGFALSLAASVEILVPSGSGGPGGGGSVLLPGDGPQAGGIGCVA